MNTYYLKIIAGGGKLITDIVECDRCEIGDGMYKFVNDMSDKETRTIAAYPINRTIVDKIKIPD